MFDRTAPPASASGGPDRIPGYDYGRVSRSPVTMTDLDRLKEAVWLTADDEQALGEAAVILADQAADMVTAYRARLGQQPWLAGYSGHPDGTPDPEYGAATKPRFDQWILDACLRPLDQDWLDYQHEIGRRHTRPGRTGPITPTRSIRCRCAICWPSPRWSSPRPVTTFRLGARPLSRWIACMPLSRNRSCCT